MGINKNGIITSGGISDMSPTHDMKVKVLSDNSVWARIHWLDVTNLKEWYADKAEVMKCINKTNRYSRMGIVDQFRTSDGIYEFMLTYPSLSATLYNRWRQTSSPNESTVTGFTAIATAWSAHNYGIRLHGTYSVYNCDTGTTWFTAIGQLRPWTSTQYIPAADGSSQTSTELWVRIDTLPRQTQLRVYTDFINAKEFIEL